MILRSQRRPVPASPSRRRFLQGLALGGAALATGTLRGSYLSSSASLEVAGSSVVHLSASHPGSGIVAIETHEPKV